MMTILSGDDTFNNCLAISLSLYTASVVCQVTFKEEIVTPHEISSRCSALSFQR